MDLMNKDILTALKLANTFDVDFSLSQASIEKWKKAESELESGCDHTEDCGLAEKIILKSTAFTKVFWHRQNYRKLPVSLNSAFDITLYKPSIAVLESWGAFGPPISVLVHPGDTANILIF